VVMLTRLQNFPSGNKSGLNQFLFGQASAISPYDLKIMAVLSGIVLAVVLLAYKELAATSFDEEFAAACGIPARAIHFLLMMLVAIAIVISIQAVGIVLLSAMLITPAATAYLLTDRLKVMILLSVVFGAVAGVAGANISFLESHLPTGPFIVAVLMLFFVAVFFFSPQHGLFTQLHRRHRRQRQSLADHVVRLLRAGSFSQTPTIEQLAKALHTPAHQMRKAVQLLRGDAIVQTVSGGLELTASGREYAEMLDRNAKLWELFLAQEGTLADVQFDPDTDDIEQVLGVDLKRQLEAQLNAVH
jgi:manganese/zinc/iron transport system permease protein